VALSKSDGECGSSWSTGALPVLPVVATRMLGVATSLVKKWLS
jgi:hypothetical protein